MESTSSFTWYLPAVARYSILADGHVPERHSSAQLQTCVVRGVSHTGTNKLDLHGIMQIRSYQNQGQRVSKILERVLVIRANFEHEAMLTLRHWNSVTQALVAALALSMVLRTAWRTAPHMIYTQASAT